MKKLQASHDNLNKTIKELTREREEQKEAAQKRDREKKELFKALEEEEAKNAEQASEIAELKRQLAEKDGMLDQSQGHKHMVSKIAK